MNYKNYSNDDLKEAYNTMLDYSGKADTNILSEINNRGGIETFLRNIELEKNHKTETNRIAKQVYSLSNDYADLEFIKQFVHSEIFSNVELEKLVVQKFNEHRQILEDRKIDQKTIFGSLIGMICGVIVSSIIYIILVNSLGRIIFYPLIGVYFICYHIIKLITKQTRENTFVFITTILGTILTLIITFLYFR